MMPLQMLRRLFAQKNSAVRSVRREMAALGIPLDGLTDEQIEQGTLRLAHSMRRSGMTTQEFAERLDLSVRRASYARVSTFG